MSKKPDANMRVGAATGAHDANMRVDAAAGPHDSNMKIVAGMGSLDDYEDFCLAGVDEVFTGYVPLDYMEKYGREKPINRREVIYYNVSIGSLSELMILKDMQECLKKEVSIAFNAIALSDAQRKEIVSIIENCIKVGFKRFIIADLKLLKLLEGYEDISIELSGEVGEVNHLLLTELKQKNLRRIIFPRQTSLEEIQSIIGHNDNKEMEYEAFLLNERCHYTGAYCNSAHCDELCHICKVPYELKGMQEYDKLDANNDRRPESPYGVNEDRKPECLSAVDENMRHESELSGDFDESGLVGESGCGLCALWALKKAGVTHLKLVSRGNFKEQTVEDIKTIKKALMILGNAVSQDDYIGKMKESIFPGGCSHNCYYTIDKEDKR